MKLKLYQKALILLAISLAILIITNPSYQDFKNFIGHSSGDSVTRDRNYFVCSTYKVTFYFDGKEYPNYFIGILGNFYEVKKDTQKD
jgi:hypothetical protein